MFIDIFARRYEGTTLREGFEDRDRRLLVQVTRILTEDVCPYPADAKEGSVADTFWNPLHSRLSRELGLTELAPEWVFWTSKWNGNEVQQSYKNNPLKRCEKWMLEPPARDADRHIKERLSLVELAFRQREEGITAMNADPIRNPDDPPLFVATTLRLPVPTNYGEQIRQMRVGVTEGFKRHVEELNVRFRQAGYSLHYHNGFIQAATDTVIQEFLETPFWALVGDPRWR